MEKISKIDTMNMPLGKSNASKLVIINRRGFIKSLGISGPLLVPIKVPNNILLDLLKTDTEIWEVNPKNQKEKVLLSISNFDTEKFNPSKFPDKPLKPMSLSIIEESKEEKTEISLKESISNHDITPDESEGEIINETVISNDNDTNENNSIESKNDEKNNYQNKKKYNNYKKK